VAKILSLSVIASIWPIYVIIYCILHWIAMTIGILIDAKGILEFCRIYNISSHMQPSSKEHIYSVLFASIIGIVHIFIYLNTTNSDAFFKYRCFYFLSFFENFASNFLWIINYPAAVRDTWYFNILYVIYTVSFFLGIVAMLLYYFCIIFYPKKHICPNTKSIIINTTIKTNVTKL